MEVLKPYKRICSGHRSIVTDVGYRRNGGLPPRLLPEHWSFTNYSMR